MSTPSIGRSRLVSRARQRHLTRHRPSHPSDAVAGNGMGRYFHAGQTLSRNAAILVLAPVRGRRQRSDQPRRLIALVVPGGTATIPCCGHTRMGEISVLSRRGPAMPRQAQPGNGTTGRPLCVNARHLRHARQHRQSLPLSGTRRRPHDCRINPTWSAVISDKGEASRRLLQCRCLRPSAARCPDHG
jgi:hypothetical protein